MKIRIDYVSNSSSSSFIVINNTNKEDLNFGGEKVYVPCDKGTYKFGWAFKTYKDFWSKLNWCAIMLAEIHTFKDRKLEITEDTPDWEKDLISREIYWKKNYSKILRMLKKVCLEKFNLNVELSMQNIDELYAYIDHQSNLIEEPKNAEMFDSDSKLYNFLVSKDSYIQGGNDNYNPEEAQYYAKNWD